MGHLLLSLIWPVAVLVAGFFIVKYNSKSVSTGARIAAIITWVGAVIFLIYNVVNVTDTQFLPNVFCVIPLIILAVVIASAPAV